MSRPNESEGILIKSIDGFFYVETGQGLFECRARGLFRKNGTKLVAGDRVKVLLDETTGNVITEVLKRKNLLVRPPVANMDKLIIVSALKEPAPNFLVIDRLTAIACNRDIEPVVVFSKSDLDSAEKYINIYKKAGITSFAVSCKTGEGAEEIKRELKGHISAFAGNTGVGKSSILNMIMPELNLATGEISAKLGRGRHTTRESQLFKVEGGYVADTPGFSSLEFEGDDIMLKENVAFGFKEFLPYLGKCRFSTCRHINDKGCKIVEAVQNGEISGSRHSSYIAMLNQAMEIKEWELRK
ncbi:MAG: ribosome small subunit-dependent GTPase A [Clostridia bacterium]|nr:ribosome small subunit-dependent GTPase A [Clostridia bacterium]